MEILEKYPLDFDALYKGDEVPTEKLQEIIPHAMGSDEYRFAIMALQQRVTDELSERGIEAVVVQRKGGLRILTDSEASAHCYNEAQRGYRLIGRNLKRQIVVDQTVLTDDERRIHESRINVTSRMYQAATAAQKDARKIEGARPFMPKMLDGGAEATASAELAGEGIALQDAFPSSSTAVTDDPGHDYE